MEYHELNKHFTAPEIISPFYSNIRIPRKLKKKMKKSCRLIWLGNDNGARLWYYMGKTNPNYKEFLIKQICK